MRISRGGLAVALLGSVTACTALPPEAPIRISVQLPIARFSLPNGLEVVVQEDHRTPRVAINLRYHAGSKDDPAGRAGMAHLVEHLQFAESEHTAHDSFFRTMYELGAEQINGTTGPDATSYFETVPPSSLEPALWIEADRMASARLGWTASSIAREKNVVAQELRLRNRNEPEGFLYAILTQAAYPEGHPYRRALDEEQQERSSTESDLREFGAHFYGPNNATLMLVGDVTLDQAKEMVARNFGAIAPCVLPPPRTIAPVDVTVFKRIHVVADVDAARAVMVWSSPAPTDDGYYEVGYATSLLAGNVATFLEEKQKTSRVRSTSWHREANRLGSLTYVMTTPISGDGASDLADAIDIMRARITTNGWHSLGAYRSSSIAERIRGVEGLGDRASNMQRDLELFGAPDHVMDDLRATQAVTAARQVAAVDHFLDPAHATLVVITPDPNAPRAGKIVEEVRR